METNFSWMYVEEPNLKYLVLNSMVWRAVIFFGVFSSFGFWLCFWWFLASGCFWFLVAFGFWRLLASGGFWLLMAFGLWWILLAFGFLVVAGFRWFLAFWLLLVAFGFGRLLVFGGIWLLLAFGFLWLLIYYLFVTCPYNLFSHSVRTPWGGGPAPFPPTPSSLINFVLSIQLHVSICL